MINLENEQTYELNDLKKHIPTGRVSGPAEIIRRSGAYTLVKLEVNNEYYLIR